MSLAAGGSGEREVAPRGSGQASDEQESSGGSRKEMAPAF